MNLDATTIVMVILVLGALGGAAFFMMKNAKNKLVHQRAEKILQQFSAAPSVKKQLDLSLKKIDKDLGLNEKIRLLPSISRLKEKLEKTGKDISLKQYLKWCIITAIGVTLFFKFGLGARSILTAAIFGLALGLLIPHMMVNRWINKRNKKFLMLLPDALDLMIRGLRSGLPVTESINVIKEEIQDPVKSVFAEIAQSVRIGIPFEESLVRAAKKIKLNEFNFFVISIALQRETGGNLAEILENLSTTIRARAMFKLKIKAMTSEAKMSAYIVGSLPFFVTIALTFISPGYLDILFEDYRGNIALGAAGCSLSFGVFVMFKMAKMEV